jgi:TRAP-type C4-dicarboxylate transport system permease large subunit
MAVAYGAIGDVSIAGLFLGGIVPGLLVGFGLIVYCYFFGPAGFRRPRSSFGNLLGATKAAALRGPIVVSDWIGDVAGDDPHKIMLLLLLVFVIVGDFIEPVPAIIIFMPVVNMLTAAASIKSVHMCVVATTAHPGSANSRRLTRGAMPR